MRGKLVFTLSALTLFLLTEAHAQYEAVFPALDGPALIQALQNNYSPDQVLPFGNSRDTLFSRVDAHNDSLTCVYTGYTIYLDPTQDPTVAAFSKGINTEHTYPQAFGASQEPARADMHHLYPTREDVNAARANLPFREVPDGQTQTWFYLGQQQSNIPSANRDLYSEYSSIGFEPPEAQKGDVARAMFYFYTIYRIQANAEGDLTERARRRAAELADDAEIRTMAPRMLVTPPQPGEIHTRIRSLDPRDRRDPRLPPPGSAIVRQYKGRTIRVSVLADGEGFEFEGERYRTLSVVAETVTGQHINGYRFFGLRGGR